MTSLWPPSGDRRRRHLGHLSTATLCPAPRTLLRASPSSRTHISFAVVFIVFAAVASVVASKSGRFLSFLRATTHLQRPASPLSPWRFLVAHASGV